MGEAGAIRPVWEVPMLSEQMEPPVFDIDPDVIAELGRKGPCCLPFPAGFFEWPGEGGHDPFFIEIVGAVALDAVSTLIVFPDHILVRNKVPVGAAPRELFGSPQVSGFLCVAGDQMTGGFQLRIHEENRVMVVSVGGGNDRIVDRTFPVRWGEAACLFLVGLAGLAGLAGLVRLVPR